MLRTLLIGLDKIPALALYSAIVAYRNIYSRFSAPRCRFYPSCSQYGLDVLKKHGFFMGLHRIVWRIVRCNPFNDGGYDPVK